MESKRRFMARLNKVRLAAVLFSVTGTLASQSAPVGPEVQRYAPLRLFGTNLYDFSEVIQSVLSGHPDPEHCIRGKIQEVNVAGMAGSMTIRRASAPGGFALHANGSNSVSNPDDQIVALAAVSLAKSTNGMISLDQYRALSPGAQAYFEWLQPTEDVLIVSLPPEFLQLGKTVQLFALARGRLKIKSEVFGPEGILYFDYGKRYVGDPNLFNSVTQVTPHGVFIKRVSDSALAGSGSSQNLVGWQLTEATNGAAHAQYSVAKRYFQGEGLPQDEVLGLYWLKRAAEQNFPDAVRILEARGVPVSSASRGDKVTK